MNVGVSTKDVGAGQFLGMLVVKSNFNIKSSLCSAQHFLRLHGRKLGTAKPSSFMRKSSLWTAVICLTLNL